LRRGAVLIAGATGGQATITFDGRTIQAPALPTDDPLLLANAGLIDGEVLVDSSASNDAIATIYISVDVLDPGRAAAGSANITGLRAAPWTDHELRSFETLRSDVREQSRLDFATGASTSMSDAAWVEVPGDERRVTAWLTRSLLATTAILTLVAIGFGMSLNRVEQRGDDEVLQSLGASPSFRRRSAILEAASLTGLAMVIALPVGLAIAFVIRRQISSVDTVVPWGPVSAVVIGLPVIAAVLFGVPRQATRRVEPNLW
jgi:uncharacterized membrane protein